ncbi:MAG: heavy metal-binding domain-containing protein [Sphingomonadales bacterium]|nr:heavy metal-binding domain-containing protein [Sphingomonadales bacterium]
MLLDILSNIPLFVDGFANALSDIWASSNIWASSDIWSWNVISRDEKVEKLREIAGLFENIPFMGGYQDLLDNGWSLSVALKFIRDAVILGAIGWFIAWWLERKHLKYLTAREAELKHITVEAGPKELSEVAQSSANMFTGMSGMFTGSVVLSHDGFRSITIAIAKIFGGNIKQYERLLDRARRQAIIRLKEDAEGQGVTRIVNMKMLTTSITRKGPKAVEIVVYGTGVAS